MGPKMREVLRLFRLHESGKAGYNADFRNDDKWDLVHMTFDQVRALGRAQVTMQHEASSAIGAYQFITPTLDSLKKTLGLTGRETFDVALQDDLAVALMIRRGLMDFGRGKISAETFCNNLAKEWASLPVVTAIKGARRQLKPGQSYYSGDGLNKAFHKPEVILAAVRALGKEMQSWIH